MWAPVLALVPGAAVVLQGNGVRNTAPSGKCVCDSVGGEGKRGKETELRGALS